MNQIAKFLPRVGAPASSDSTSPEATLPAPRSANSAIARVEARLTPASPKEMALALNELLSVYGVPAGWDVGASVYRRLWANLPGDVLRDAIDRHLAESPWFPKPAEILERAQDEMAWRRKSLDHAALPIPAPAPVVRRITANEAAEAVKAFWEKRGGRLDEEGATMCPVSCEPRYVVDEVPETIAGKPWRSDG